MSTTQVNEPAASSQALDARGADQGFDQLVAKIKAHIARGDKAKEKSEQHYCAAGKHLETLKNDGAHKGHGMTWDAFVQEFCLIGRSRADELIMIADGRKSLADARAGTNQRQIAHRKKKPPLRNGGNPTTKSTDENDEVLTVEDDLEPDEYRESFLLRTADAVVFAVYSGNVDKEVLAAAKRVVAAWQELIQTMEPDPIADSAEARKLEAAADEAPDPRQLDLLNLITPQGEAEPPTQGPTEPTNGSHPLDVPTFIRRAPVEVPA